MKYPLFFGSILLLSVSAVGYADSEPPSLSDRLSCKLKKIRECARNDEDVVILQDGTQIIGQISHFPTIKFKDGEKVLNPDDFLCIEVGLHQGKVKMQLVSSEGKGFLCDLPEERFSIVQYFPSLKNPTHRLTQEISAQTISQIIFRRGDRLPLAEEIAWNTQDQTEEVEKLAERTQALNEQLKALQGKVDALEELEKDFSALSGKMEEESGLHDKTKEILEEYKHKVGSYRTELSHLREAQQNLYSSLHGEREGFRGKETLYNDQIGKLEQAVQILTDKLEQESSHAHQLEEQLGQMKQNRDTLKEKYGSFKSEVDERVEELSRLRDAQKALNDTLLEQLEDLVAINEHHIEEKEVLRGHNEAQAQLLYEKESSLDQLRKENEALQSSIAEVQSRLASEATVRQQQESQLKILNAHLHQLKEGNERLEVLDKLHQTTVRLEEENAQLKQQLTQELEKFGVMRTHLSGVLLKYEQEKALRQELEKRLKAGKELSERNGE